MRKNRRKKNPIKQKKTATKFKKNRNFEKTERNTLTKQSKSKTNHNFNKQSLSKYKGKTNNIILTHVIMLSMMEIKWLQLAFNNWGNVTKKEKM